MSAVREPEVSVRGVRKRAGSCGSAFAMPTDRRSTPGSTECHRDPVPSRACASGHALPAGSGELALEHVPLPIALVSLDGHIARASRRFAELLGRGATELEGCRLADLSHPDDATLDFPHALTLVARQAAEYRVERRLQRADGEMLWVAQTVTLVRDEHGEPTHFVAAFADLTPQRASAEELRRLGMEADEARRAAQRLAAVLEEASDGAWTWDVPADCLTRTPRCAERFGTGDAATSGTRPALEAIVHPDDRAAFQTALEQLVAGERGAISLEHRMRDRDGEWRWVLTRARASARDVAGRATAIVGTHQDIDAHARAVRHLRVLARLGDRLQRLANGGARAGALRLLAEHFDAATCALEPVARTSGSPLEPPGFAAIPCVAAALMGGDPVVVSDAATDSRTVAVFDALFAPLGGGSLAAVPLFDGSRWVASLVVVARGRRTWSTEDVALLRAVAHLFLLAGLHRAPRTTPAAAFAPIADRVTAAPR